MMNAFARKLKVNFIGHPVGIGMGLHNLRNPGGIATAHAHDHRQAIGFSRFENEGIAHSAACYTHAKSP